ncbi:integrase core domain-containing protein [Candidatus Bipolaricaulota bacterium]
MEAEPHPNLRAVHRSPARNRSGQRCQRPIEGWRFEYNEMRPHSSLGNRARAVYVAELLGVGASL